jgi:transcriptional regulator with XRE-family HTH domain
VRDLGFGLTSDQVNRALGEELRRARTASGLSRAQVVADLVDDIHEQTLATYELGTRQCTVARLVQICRVLDLGAPDLLGLALQRAMVDLHLLKVQVDLHAVLADDSEELAPMRLWAANRLALSALDGSATVHLDPGTVVEMAFLCGLTVDGLAKHLRDFAPDPGSALQG